MRRTAVLALVVAVLVSLLVWSQHRPGPAVVSGFIEADEIRLGSRVGGRVAKVLVQEGDDVAPGQVLVELEPFDLQDRLAQADARWRQQVARHEELTRGSRPEEVRQGAARVQQAQAQLDRLRHGARPQELDAARADVALAQAEVELAEAEMARVRTLDAQDAVTAQRRDRALTELRVAGERLQSRKAQLELLEAGARVEDVAAAEAQLEEATQALALLTLGPREEVIAAAYAAMQASESERSAAQAQLNELAIRAPQAARVEAVELQPGDLVAAGAPVLSLLDGRSLWVRAYVPESHLGLQLGARLRVRLDSFPEEEFTGEVTYIARQAEFTPSNVQTAEERAKQVFRIKIRVDDPQGRLRPGMAADVHLDPSP